MRQSELPHSLLQSVQNALQPYAPTKVVLALSGGLDSMVLLQLLTQLQQSMSFELHSCYVHHGLNAQASAWASFCAEQAALRQVPHQTLCVSLAEPGRNIEAQARQLRYQALTELLQQPTDLLLTAHHADDQLETLLLALKRGSGMAGLSGIAPVKACGAGWLVRPLLAHSRLELEQYAKTQQLLHIEDDSNQDERFDRNFLRHQVLPLLAERWPGFSLTASRSIGFIQQNHQLLAQNLQQMLAAVQKGDRLDLPGLQQLTPPYPMLVLRQFLQQFGVVPEQRQLTSIWQELVLAKADATPLVQLGDWQLRRYQQQLYLLDQKQQRLCALPQAAVQILPPEQPQILPTAELTLCWHVQRPTAAAINQYLPLPLSVAATVTVEFGTLNRPFKPAGHSQHKSVKQWLKLWGVPPWRRGSVPLIIAGQQIVAVVGFASVVAAEQAQSWLSIQPVITSTLTKP